MISNKQFNLICFPHAGAGASVFNEWKEISQKINIIAVQLPGREKKFVEPLYTNINSAIDGLLNEITSKIIEDLPVVIFGHCMGSLLSYELTQKLINNKIHSVNHLIVSGCSGPYRNKPIDNLTLSDNDFIENIEKITGYKHPALENPAMRDLILPILKADVEMNDTYKPYTTTPLNIPVTTIRGTDDQLVSSEQIRSWDKASSTKVSHIELPGDHMYITSSAEKIIEIILDIAKNY